MSITLGQLASRFMVASQKIQPASQQQLRTLAQVGVGYVKTEIQGMHAVDTGTMLNSTTAEQVNKDTMLVGPTVSYAPYVALGTSVMPARPFHITAARRLQGAINQGDILRDIGLR
ncbi:minor capsid protein [Microbacterium phage Ixel]|nr:minor capsid protein [Microbacterium phage Ixel]